MRVISDTPDKEKTTMLSNQCKSGASAVHLLWEAWKISTDCQSILTRHIIERLAVISRLEWQSGENEGDRRNGKSICVRLNHLRQIGAVGTRFMPVGRRALTERKIQSVTHKRSVSVLRNRWDKRLSEMLPMLQDI